MSFLLAAIVTASGPMLVERLSFERDALEQLTTSWSTTTTLEMLMMPATVSNIDGMGFAKPDLLKLSLFGDSNTQTRFSLEGIDMSDPLHAGDQAIRVPFAMLSAMRLRFAETTDSLESGVEYEIDSPHRLQAIGRNAFPQLGGISPGGIALFEALARHRHALSIDPPPPAERRRFIENASASLVVNEGAWLVGAEVDAGQRRFLRLAMLDDDGSFDETFVLASAVARYRHRLFDLIFAVDYRFRENTNAEHFYGESETFPRHSLAAFFGAKTKHLKAGVTAKLENDSATGASFDRELRDVDGQALMPYSPRGTRLGVGLDITFEDDVRGVTKVFAHLGQRAVIGAPNLRTWSNALTLDGVPMGRYDHVAALSSYAYGQLEAGLRDTRKLGQFQIGYSFYGVLSHMQHAGRLGTVAAVDVGIKAYAQWRGTRWFMPFIAVSRTPVAFTQNVAEALDPNSMLTKGYDANGDLYDTQGGAQIDTPNALALPKTHSAAFGWQTQLSDKWTFNIFALGKTFDNTLWLRSATEGAAVVSGDRSFLTGGEKRYSLVNYPFPETPFYVGAHLQLTGTDKNRYVFTLGGSAYFSLGSTAFGFGPTANDVGVVDASMANPNTRRYVQGNLEGDRAYYVKLGFALRIVHTLWAAFGLRYRDGRPFAYLDWRSENGQAQPIYTSPKGSLYRLDGPRESGRVNIDVKLSYTIPLPNAGLRLSFLVWNVFDLAAPITERQLVGGDTVRSGAELEVPRAAMLTAELLLP